MIFSRKKHRLPKFPDGAAETFKSLCCNIENDEIGLLNKLLDRAYQSLTASSASHPQMNLKRLEEVYSVGSYLITHFNSFSKDEQALIVGAIRYFAADDDLVSDTTFYTGFDDDAKIMNYVLDQIGINDRYIKLQGSIWG